MAPRIHYGWETTYPESNEPDSWGTACGRTCFECYTISCKGYSNKTNPNKNSNPVILGG